MSGLVDVMGGSKAEKIMKETWGHLDATPGKQYSGTIVFGQGAFRELFILTCDFGDEAGYGPWFYEGVQHWLSQQTTDTSMLYRFEGTYLLTGSGKHIFDGAVKAVTLS